MAENSVTDVNSLFQKQSVTEIEDVERQIRGDIEKKKQDLRVMVGERYRDLINAADTIQDMQKITGEMSSDIRIISDLCASFGRRKSKENTSPVKKANKVNEEAFYALATQMDLLVDTPEKIWSALDTGQFLAASQFYLLSRHIVNNSLNINPGQLKKGSQRDIFKSFPILHHQWAAISHFKPSILKGSRTALKDSTLPDQSVAESLCSIVLLEDYSPRQVFTELLMARKTAFQDVFHPSFHATSVKKQICDITHMLRLTIEQIVTLFYTDETKGTQKPLFYEALQEITDEKVVKKGKLFEDLFEDEVDVLTVSRYLPQGVIGFLPKLRSIPVSISVSYIQKHAVEWLNGCKKDIQQGIKGLLSFISNIKGLALIRDAVYDLLKVVSDDYNEVDENSEERVKLLWNDLCQICLNRPLSIWDELFRPLFFERVKEILESQCSKCFEDVQASLHTTLEELKEGSNHVTDTCWDHDYADFVWHEFPQDFQSNAPQDSMLSLKVNCCTPSTKRLCDDLNNILKTILDDVQHFINDDQSSDEVDQAEMRMKNIRKDVQKMLLDQDDVFNENNIEPFQRFSDANSIRELLNATFNVGVDTLCDHISSILTETKEALQNTDLKASTEVNMQLDRAVYVSRFCVSIPEVCENIRKITEIEEKPAKQPMKRQLSSHTKDSLYKAMKKTSSESLQRIHRLFRDQGAIAVAIWSDWLAKMVSRLVADTLRSRDEHFVFSTTNWEEVAIEEEGEQGQEVKSSIHVPAQPSFYLSSLLYRLAEEFHRVGGGMFERTAVQRLSVDIANAILEAHELCVDQLKDEKTFQNRIFQVIYDLKFITNLLCGNTDHKEQVVAMFRQRSKKFIALLEQLVDPFDLDVFMPHIDQFVNKQISRSSLIYGCISNIDKHNAQAQRTTSNEKANIVPLISNPPRFMLLPISSHAKDNNGSIMEPFVGFDSTTRPLYQHQSQVSLTAVV